MTLKLPSVYGWLNIAAVNAFVSGRIHGFGHAGESPEYPYITWQVVNKAATNYQDRAPDTDRQRVQIDIWSRDQAEAISLAGVVEEALDPHGHQLVQIGPSRDPETKSHRVQFDYSFWTHR